MSFPDRHIQDFVATSHTAAFRTDSVFVDGVGLIETEYQVQLMSNERLSARTYDGQR